MVPIGSGTSSKEQLEGIFNFGLRKTVAAGQEGRRGVGLTLLPETAEETDQVHKKQFSRLWNDDQGQWSLRDGKQTRRVSPMVASPYCLEFLGHVKGEGSEAEPRSHSPCSEK